MKKIIAALIALAFIVPALGHSFEDIKKGVTPEKDKQGGYTHTQSNYKDRLYQQSAKKKKGGYHSGGYHNKSPHFQQKEYQFIESAGSTSHSKKKSNKN